MKSENQFRCIPLAPDKSQNPRFLQINTAQASHLGRIAAGCPACLCFTAEAMRRALPDPHSQRTLPITIQPILDLGMKIHRPGFRSS
jgi:hypothetical protein